MSFLLVYSYFDTKTLFAFMILYILFGLVISTFVKPTVVIITDETDKIQAEVIESKKEILASNQYIINILEKKNNA